MHSGSNVSPPAAEISIRFATAEDIPSILRFIRELAEYEKLSHHVVITEEDLHVALFSERPAAEALLAFDDRQAIGFALRQGSLSAPCSDCRGAPVLPAGLGSARLERSSHPLLPNPWGGGDG